MNNNPFERSTKMIWIGIAIIMAIPIAFISILAFMTIGGTSTSCLPFYAGIFLVFALICSLPIIQLKTKYTDNGIEQPSIFGSKFLRWQDVAEIRNITAVRNITAGGLILIGPNVKIIVNLFLFKNPQEFLSEIRSRIPETVYPSDTQINQEIYRRKQSDTGAEAISALICTILIIVFGKNIFALVLGILMVAYMLYKIRNWLKYKRLQS